FQAEDGIRDRNVTGVQTCALPICFVVGEAASFACLPGEAGSFAYDQRECTGVDLSRRANGSAIVGVSTIAPRPADIPPSEQAMRSEERRVGKGCRTRRVTGELTEE